MQRKSQPRSFQKLEQRLIMKPGRGNMQLRGFPSPQALKVVKVKILLSNSTSQIRATRFDVATMWRNYSNGALAIKNKHSEVFALYLLSLKLL
jgi:hypothetical protein